jgi:two-component system, NarL family, sensor kinase
MNATNQHDLILAVVVATILFFVMVAFIVSYFIIYRRKREQHVYEMKAAKEEFEKQLLKSQLEIQEQTFNQISQEIHDNVGQLLSLARIQINIMNESANFDRRMLDEVKANIGKAMVDLRDIARSLNSERIRNASIIEAVGIESERVNKSGIIRTRLAVEGAECGLNEQKKFILFRIIQECLQNILKHAEAKDVVIRFLYLPSELQVVVQDDGKGFDPEGMVDNEGGMGLVNIRKRIGLTGGNLVIDSGKLKGTSIHIKIPYE